MTIVDVTVPIQDAMTVYRGNPPVRIRPAMTLAKDGVNLSELCLGSHTGTHVDAPSHFIKGGKGIDRLDLRHFIGTAWVADLSRVVGGIGAEHLRRARIPKGSRRILLRTSNSRLWHPARAFRTDFVYLAPEGADWMIERGVELVGIDYLSIEGYRVPGAPTHKRLLGAGIPILEGLDLFKVRPGRWEMVALPLRIANGDAGLTRAVLWKA
ncbi:MAG TPA: cyclase family protein [Candidatus Dormibacteraeota bacterium]|nr:cyclase family protein [Candidatus Dormibacteraeota bacterium]